MKSRIGDLSVTSSEWEYPYDTLIFVLGNNNIFSNLLNDSKSWHRSFPLHRRNDPADPSTVTSKLIKDGFGFPVPCEVYVASNDLPVPNIPPADASYTKASVLFPSASVTEPTILHQAFRSITDFW